MSHRLVLSYLDQLQILLLLLNASPCHTSQTTCAPGRWAEQLVKGGNQEGAGAIRLCAAGQAARTPQINRERGLPKQEAGAMKAK